MTVEYRSGNADEPQVPRWVGVMIAVVLVGSMAGGGALWAWSYYSKPNEKDLMEVRASPAILNVAPRPPQNNTITMNSSPSSSTKSYTFRATDILASAVKGANDADYKFTFIYSKPDLLTPDQMTALRARNRLVQDVAEAKFLKVNDDQVKQLKDMSATPISAQLVVSPADTAKMKSLFAAYLASPKSDNEQAVVKAVQQIGLASVKATRDVLVPMATKVAQILTPEQLAPFKQ